MNETKSVIKAQFPDVEKFDTLLKEIKKLKSLVESAAKSERSAPKRLFSINEASEYLGIGKTETYAHLRRHVRTINHGKKILIPKEELDSLIEKAKRKGELFS